MSGLMVFMDDEFDARKVKHLVRVVVGLFAAGRLAYRQETLVYRSNEKASQRLATAIERRKAMPDVKKVEELVRGARKEEREKCAKIAHRECPCSMPFEQCAAAQNILAADE